MPTTTNSSSSSSPSSLAFHFPSSIPKKDQPNAHPYAIKTSSTAILSRSNSTSAHASVGPHHYIPSSPSTTSPQHSPAKQHRPSRHRYSRSLTSDLPPALPPPPGASLSASPNQTHFSESDSDNTPRRRGQRAETLPSSAGPLIQNLDLPNDPKTWTPSQLSKYLSTTLRAGDENLPMPIAKDIAKFISDNRITGKTFLRFSEDDLLQFGVNQLWRTTLLTASRSLRQTILRSRIWGFGNAPIPAEEDEDLGSMSSPSSNVSSSRKALRRRSRHSSSKSSSSDHGRVKDMIDSFENASPIHSDGSNGHVSPTKLSAGHDSFSSNHHHHSVESSPTKYHRPLPHRGSVNDLFNPTNGDSDVAVDEKEEDNTIKNVAKRNLHGREPRMLPFPPTGPMITPMHTGAGFPLPLSPEHTGLSYHGADYEIGFRHHTRSPHSQVFVVRHNPASPSHVLHVDDKKSKRLLPFPPMTGETHLHHPKPRRLIGTNTGVANLDSNDDSGGNRTTDATTSGTEGYETALETQSESESVVSTTGTVQHDEAKDAEQPSIQELLVTEPYKPISGVEAWELELGETVKRIGADMNSNLDGKSGGSVAEIGRKAGRHPHGGTTRSKKDEVSSKKSGLMSLFQPQEEAAPGVSGAQETDLGSELEDKQAEFNRNLELKEQQLAAREQSIALRELEVERREKAVVIQERDLHDRQASDQEHTSAKRRQLHEQASGLEERERALEAMEKAIKLKEADITRREENLRKKEVEVKEWEQRVKAKETELDERIEREEQSRAAAAADAVSETPWLLRTCCSLLGIDRYLPSSSTSSSSSSTSAAAAATGSGSTRSQPPPHQTATRSIKRDILLGPSRSGGYLILMSIGVCVVVLRVLGKKAGGVIGRR